MGIFEISYAVEEASGPPALFPMTEEEAPGSFSVNLITREEASVCSDSSLGETILGLLLENRKRKKKVYKTLPPAFCG